MKISYSFRNYSVAWGLVLMAAACGSSTKKDPPRTGGGPNRQMAVSVDAFIVDKRTISENIEVPGSLLAGEATEIHPEVSGRVVQLNVSEGRFVNKGTLLAKIYDGDLQAQLKKLQVQLEIAKQTEQRQAQLVKIQGISQQDYDLSLLQVNNLNADIDIIRTSISKTEIRAPFAGRLGLKNISPGAYISPTTIITTISQVQQLKLDFTIPEKYSGQINVGQNVQFTVEGKPDRYAAKVMATEATVTENTRTLRIRAIVQDKKKTLIPGTFAKVILNFAPDPNALMIPTEAVIPQARGKKVIVYKDGSARFTDVTTGVRDSSFVQITSGLNEGDTVVTTGLLSIRPEGKIRISKISNQ